MTLQPAVLSNSKPVSEYNRTTASFGRIICTYITPEFLRRYTMQLNANRFSMAMVIANLCTCLVLTPQTYSQAEGGQSSDDFSETIGPPNELARRASWSQPSETKNAERLTKWLSEQSETNSERVALEKTSSRVMVWTPLIISCVSSALSRNNIKDC